MSFFEVVDRVVELLRRRGRVSYRALKLEFGLNDEQLEALREEIVGSHELAEDQDGRALVWTGGAGGAGATGGRAAPPDVAAPAPPARLPSGEAERRQLTLMFCDLVDVTALSGRLDPEELREVINAYQAACAQVIDRHEGHVAQYLGDGILVYFGFPQAHEEASQLAVRAALGILQAMRELNAGLERDRGIRLSVRTGIHTGPVVVGEVGSGRSREQLALGEAPNVAARIQGVAAPDTVVISETTHRLVRGYFACEDLGERSLKGVGRPVRVYRVLGESGARSRLEAATADLTPLVGRESEVALLAARWARAAGGEGQVMLLSGEAGVGKSRLVEVLGASVAREGHAAIQWRCSAQHTNSALYPLIDHLRRLLRFQEGEAAEDRLGRLEEALRRVDLPLVEMVPLFAALLSVPTGDRYPPVQLSPAMQRQRTSEALCAWLLAEAERAPVLAVLEDLQWADPSTLDALTVLLEQVPTARLFVLLTCRPGVDPPALMRSHVTRLPVGPLAEVHVRDVIEQVGGGRRLPPEVVQHVVAKTDGIPLFVEEMTRAILGMNVLDETGDGYALRGPLASLAIPATLEDALMARLDRLPGAKPVAQLGAVIGRQFSRALLLAVAPVDEAAVEQELTRLVEAELLYRRGIGRATTYVFKHAMVHDAAYQSLLRRTRQEHHRRIAQALVEGFPEAVEREPELLARHYTEAGLAREAVGYWRKAGERTAERGAVAEAIHHLTRGLELLRTLPEDAGRDRQEVDFQTAIGSALVASRGYAAPEVERAFERARELCRKVGDSPQLAPVLVGQWSFHLLRARYGTARELAEQLHALAGHEPALLLNSHVTRGMTALFQGEFVATREHLERGAALAAAGEHGPRTLRFSANQASCLAYLGRVVWFLGYPDQALDHATRAVTAARAQSLPLSVAQTLGMVTNLYQVRREVDLARQWSEQTIAYSVERGFPYWTALGTILRSWAQTAQGEGEAGIAAIRQSLDRYRATGATLGFTWFLALLAEAHWKAGQVEEALRVVDEAMGLVAGTGERYYEAELHRLEGELRLARGGPDAGAAAAACFQRALAVARGQSARSWELRAATSLARLWRDQGEARAARDLLGPVHGWFTEGLGTADLVEARTVLDDCQG